LGHEKSPVKKTSPYYEDDAVTIYHGDCREILPTLPPVDLVLTDPPYGIGKKARTYAGDRGPSELWDAEFDLDWLNLTERLAGCVAIMPGVANLPRMPLVFGPLTYAWTIVAHVANGMTRGVLGYGNWIPCMVYLAEGITAYVQQSDIKRVAVSGPKPEHPSPKPYAAMEWFVSRLPGETILDPFMGSGTTLRAAKDLGRKAIGIEIEEKYCEIAAKRMSQSVLAL
jgi:DNA modification methylase